MSNWWEKAQQDIDKLVNSKVATKTDAELRAIDNWINDEEIQRRRREGHANAHDKISEGVRNSRKYKEAMKNRDQSYTQTEEYKQLRRDVMARLRNDPEYLKKHKEGQEAFRNAEGFEEWFENEWRKANAKKYETPEFWANYYEGIKKRDANPEYHKKRLGASKKKIRKPVQTPLGVFETQTDAAKAHGLGNTETIRTRIKSTNPKFADYKSLTVEEYERLKGEC